MQNVYAKQGLIRIFTSKMELIFKKVRIFVH